MSNPELDRILAAADAAIHRAYALGRKDAVDQMVKYAKSDALTPPLALSAPDLPAAAPPPEHVAGITAANDHPAEPEADATMAPAEAPPAGITGLILDFVYPRRTG